ncbi:MAG TPA: hypothetical protein VFG59_08570 [Anaeromyxobacter sp.]|nr:hypothetical protein [Anaeromyxobacter sp.]
MGRSFEHHGVRGSAALSTQRLSARAVAAESLEAGDMRRLPFAGELLGAVRVRSRFVAVPLDAFDKAGPAMPPELQAAYLQLMRLSYGEGRNWCRAAKRDLEARLHVSERRLLRLLDGLVERGLVRPLHRDNRGTLWRVFLPGEGTGERSSDGVLLGRPSVALPANDVPPSAARPSATSAPLARALAEARGDLAPAALCEAEREVAELLAEGQAPRRIAAGIEALRRRGASGRPPPPAEGSST